MPISTPMATVNQIESYIGEIREDRHSGARELTEKAARVLMMLAELKGVRNAED